MMKLKNAILTALLLIGGSMSLSAVSPVPASGWTEGNYYMLKTDSYYLSLSATKTDSLILVGVPTTKTAYDYALWQVTKGTSTGAGTQYRFVNKKTKAVLSLKASINATPVLAEGVNEWSFAEGGSTIQSFYSSGDSIIALKNDAGKLIVEAGNSKIVPATKFTVEEPAMYELTSTELGDGFRTFNLTFGETYDGNIFTGKTLVAKDVADTGHHFMTLQLQDDETFANGTAKYLGVDTTKNAITNATGVFGAKFVVDSTYTAGTLHTVGNADFQKFFFTIDLKNDSIAMFVKDAPTVQAAKLAALGDSVQVVYALLNSTKVLTVGEVAKQGVAPLITSSHGQPTSISTGSGVYFLKSASLGATAGKYVTAYKSGVIVTMDATPDNFHAAGQWIVKENNGKYTIVDRNTNTSIATSDEIFAVNGMENTYTFGDRQDSITVVYRKDVDLTNAFLGTRHFTTKELADNAYRINVYSGTQGIKNVYVFTNDSIMQVNAGDSINATLFRVNEIAAKVQNTGAALGALALGDTLYHSTYSLQERISNRLIADNGNNLTKLSTTTPSLVFMFVASTTGEQYSMYVPAATENDYVGMDVTTGNLILTKTPGLFTFVAAAAPTYKKVENGYYSFQAKSSEKYLTMNPNTLFAELKSEGQEIVTKANYTANDFALDVVTADTLVEGKPMYYIYTAHADTAHTRYYLASLRDTTSISDNGSVYYRLGFVKGDSIEAKKNPAMLFAFRALENGNEGYLLENQMEATRQTSRTPFAGSVNDNAVMTSTGIAFDIKSVVSTASEIIAAPVELKVYGGEGVVTVDNVAGKRVTVYNILGRVISSGIASSAHFTIPVSAGIAIVTVEGEGAKKVVVR